MHDVSPKAEPGTATRTRPARVDTVDTPEEFATIGHMRGWCHDTSMCQICKYADKAIRSQATARTQELRAIDAQMDVAYLTRALQAMEARAVQAEHTLTSIIEG